MSVERIIYCEGPDCGGDGGLDGGHTSCHIRTATPAPYIPIGFIEVRVGEADGVRVEHHFCSWDCVMKFAAKQPIPERIEFDELPPGGAE